MQRELHKSFKGERKTKSSAGTQRPEAQPNKSDEVLRTATEKPLSPLNPRHLTSMNSVPDFTPHFVNLDPPRENRWQPSRRSGSCRFQQRQWKEPRKVTWMPLNEYMPCIQKAHGACNVEDLEESTQEMLHLIDILLNTDNEESLECLCHLLTTSGKKLDLEKVKPLMDEYFNKLEMIITEKKTSTRIRFMLQDLLELRLNNWVPRRADQGPKTIKQIHMEAKLEEYSKQIKAQQQRQAKPESCRLVPGLLLREDIEGEHIRYRLPPEQKSTGEGRKKFEDGLFITARVQRPKAQPNNSDKVLHMLSEMNGPHQFQQNQPGKIMTPALPRKDAQLNKDEKVWRPSRRKTSGPCHAEDPEDIYTQELFRRVCSLLNKLTPQMFQQLVKQMQELTINTEERLRGVIELIFQKAISEPNFSVVYANMCNYLKGVTVPMSDRPGHTVNFCKLLLSCCQKQFEQEHHEDEVLDKKQKELDAATTEEEKQHLKDKLEEARDKARRQSHGNMKFIAELFKLSMLTENIMHNCIITLLEKDNEESLECLCHLLTTSGKKLDLEKAKPRMDKYFNKLEMIIREKKTSSRIRFMLQDLLDLRLNNWVPRRADQGPKTIKQIHMEAKLEEYSKQIQVQHQLHAKTRFQW